MLGRMIVDYAAPTLAGIKPGSLFCPRMEEERLMRELRALAPGLAARGVTMRRLRAGGETLLFVFRPRMLQAVLADAPKADFLRALGYDVRTVEGVLAQLEERLAHAARAGFPHEIGLLLGYPLGDVQGFIAHGGRDCALSGPWKVYTDVESARQTFARMERCTQQCRRLFDGGVRLSALTGPLQ